jgi:hypothetical protein
MDWDPSLTENWTRPHLPVLHSPLALATRYLLQNGYDLPALGVWVVPVAADLDGILRIVSTGRHAAEDCCMPTLHGLFFARKAD